MHLTIQTNQVQSFIGTFQESAPELGFLDLSAQTMTATRSREESDQDGASLSATKTVTATREEGDQDQTHGCYEAIPVSPPEFSHLA